MNKVLKTLTLAVLLDLVVGLPLPPETPLWVGVIIGGMSFCAARDILRMAGDEL